MLDYSSKVLCFPRKEGGHLKYHYNFKNHSPRIGVRAPPSLIERRPADSGIRKTSKMTDSDHPRRRVTSEGSRTEDFFCGFFCLIKRPDPGGVMGESSHDLLELCRGVSQVCGKVHGLSNYGPPLSSAKAELGELHPALRFRWRGAQQSPPSLKKLTSSGRRSAVLETVRTFDILFASEPRTRVFGVCPHLFFSGIQTTAIIILETSKHPPSELESGGKIPC